MACGGVHRKWRNWGRGPPWSPRTIWISSRGPLLPPWPCICMFCLRFSCWDKLLAFEILTKTLTCWLNIHKNSINSVNENPCGPYHHLPLNSPVYGGGQHGHLDPPAIRGVFKPLQDVTPQVILGFQHGWLPLQDDLSELDVHMTEGADARQLTFDNLTWRGTEINI